MIGLIADSPDRFLIFDGDPRRAVFPFYVVFRAIIRIWMRFYCKPRSEINRWFDPVVRSFTAREAVSLNAYFEFHWALRTGTAAKRRRAQTPAGTCAKTPAAIGHLYGARLRTSGQICHSSLSCAGRSANTYVPVGNPARSISTGMETVPSLATTAVACWLRRAFSLFVRT